MTTTTARPLSPFRGLSSFRPNQNFHLGARPTTSLSQVEPNLLKNLKANPKTEQPYSIDANVYQYDDFLPDKSEFGPDDLFPEFKEIEPVTPVKPHADTYSISSVQQINYQPIELFNGGDQFVDNEQSISAVTYEPDEDLSSLISDTNQCNIEFYGNDVDFSPLYDLAAELEESSTGKMEYSVNSLSEEAYNFDQSPTYFDSQNYQIEASDHCTQNLSISEPSSSSVGTFNSPSFTADNWIEITANDSLSPKMNTLSSPSTSESTSTDGYSSSDSSSASDVANALSPQYFGKLEQRKKKTKRQHMTDEMKYLRKKQQNKEAAVRYRQKKKNEQKQVFETLKYEENENKKLRREYNDISQEIRFVRKLIKETLQI